MARVAQFKIAGAAVAWQLKTALVVGAAAVVLVGLWQLDILPLRHAALGVVALALIVLGLLKLTEVPGRLDIGADGALLDEGFRKKRFVPFRDLADAQTESRAVSGKSLVGSKLVLASGEEIHVVVGEEDEETRGQAERITSQILEALRRCRECDHASSAPALGRAGRPTAEWIVALRRVGLGTNEGPRDAAVLPEALWRVVSDPGAAPSQRAAAAYALSTSLDAEGRERLRIVAMDTVAPDLRTALHAALDHDDAAAAEALEALDDEGPDALRRAKA